MCAYGTSRQPRGAALVVVMLVMAVLLLAGTSFLTISWTEMQIALNERASAQANLLPEAAIHKAIAQLNANPAYSGETNMPLGGGTFTISFEPPMGPVCPGNTAKGVVAKASVPVMGGTAKAEIHATVDQVSYPYRWAAFAAILNQIVSSLWKPLAGAGVDRTSRELWIAANSLVDSFDSGGGAYDPTMNSDSTVNSGNRGNIGANGDVGLDYNAEIKGNTKAGGDIFEQSGVTVTGSKTAKANTESFRQVKPGEAGSAGLTVGDVVYVGKKKVNQTVNQTVNQMVNLSSGTYYYQYLDFKDGAALTVSGPVIIYVTGPPIPGDASGRVVRLGSNVTLGSEPGTQLRIITKSDGGPAESVRFSAGSGLRFYGSLYGTNTDVYIGDSSQIFGSLIGRTIMLGAGTKVHFDQAMSGQEVCHSENKFSIRRGTWREVI